MISEKKIRQIVNLKKIRAAAYVLLLTIPLFAQTACSADSSAEDVSASYTQYKGPQYVAPDYGAPVRDGTGKPHYLAVLGDLQEYTKNDRTVGNLIKTIKWLNTVNETSHNLGGVLQVGDITDWNMDFMWWWFREATLPLKFTVPLISSTGNHDYRWSNDDGVIANRDSTKFNSYTWQCIHQSIIEHQFEQGRRENIVVRLHIQGHPLYIMALEFGTRNDILTQAIAYVQANQDKKFILMTHEFLTGNGDLVTENSHAERQFPYADVATPSEVWTRLVYPNNNILAVVCGHNGFNAYRSTTNIAGREVPQILFNLQYQPNSGNSLVQMWEFPSDNPEMVRISIYKTDENREYTEVPARIINLPFTEKR